MWAVSAVHKVLDLLPKGRVLDIGSGSGEHARLFREHGLKVTAIDLVNGVDYMNWLPSEPFDCIWASHVLEHQRNPGAFLEKCRWDLKKDGILAITVPPRKDEIVGGHVTLWNAGLLLYNLILSGFDCSESSVLTEGYNVSVVVRKSPIKLPVLTCDHGDIDRLSEFFPMPLKEGFNGNIESINW